LKSNTKKEIRQVPQQLKVDRVAERNSKKETAKKKQAENSKALKHYAEDAMSNES
jgi:hypothetical protein